MLYSVSASALLSVTQLLLGIAGNKPWDKHHRSSELIVRLTQQICKNGCSTHGLHVGDEVRAFLIFLQARKDHLRSRNVLLWVDQVLEHMLATPCDA